MRKLSLREAVGLYAFLCTLLAVWWYLGAEVHPVLVPGILAAIVFGYSALSDHDVTGAAFPVERRPEPRPFPRDRRLADLGWTLRTARDHSTWTDRVRPHLARLALDRLRDHRGIDPATDPEAARAALGPEIWALVTGEYRPPRSTRALKALVERIHSV